MPKFRRQLAPDAPRLRNLVLWTFASTLALTPIAPSAQARDISPHDIPETRPGLTLRDVLDLVKRQSPRYLAAETAMDIAEADVRDAGVLPNPILNLAILYLNSGFNQNGVATYYANVSLPLLLGGQRRARVRTADVGVTVARAEVRDSYHRLAREAREQFTLLQAAQARVDIIDAALADLERLSDRPAAAGTSPLELERDRLQLRAEVSAWEVQRADIGDHGDEAAGRLALLLGARDYPVARGSLAPLGLHGAPAPEWSEVEQGHPAVELARRGAALADQQIALARRERIPVPVITAGTVVIQNYFSASTQAGITVPIPSFDRGQGLLARATARSKRAHRDRDVVVAEVHAELERATRALTRRARALQTFERDVLARLPALEQAFAADLTSGQTALIGLLTAIRARREIELTHIDMVQVTVLAEIAVLAVSGRIDHHPGAPS